MWTRWVLAIVAMAGCDHVFGLDHVESTAVSGRYVIRRATSQPDTSIVVADELFAPGSVTAHLATGEGSSTTVELANDGSFAFTSTGGPYRLVFVGARSFPVEIQHDAPHLDLTLRVWGRDGRTPVTMPTPVSYVPTPPSGTELVFFSTGLWSETKPTSAPNTLDWKRAGFQSGAVGLLDAALGDRLYVAVRDATSGHRSLSQFVMVSATMSDGMQLQITEPLVLIDRNMTVTVSAERGTEIARLGSPAPTYANPYGNWRVIATPSLELGPEVGITLAIGELSADVANEAQNLGNPIPGTSLLAHLGVLRSRDVMVTGATEPLRLAIRSVLWYPLTTPVEPIQLSAGQIELPSTPSLADFPLISDFQVLALPAGEPAVTWGIDAAGPVDFYIVNLFEVIVDAGTPRLSTVRQIFTTARRAPLDRDALVPGRLYAISIDSRRGLDFASGDLRLVTYPHVTANSFSAVFSVAD